MDQGLVTSKDPNRTQNEDGSRVNTQMDQHQSTTPQSEQQESRVDVEQKDDSDGATCSDNPLAFLRDEIQFQMLKQVIRDNPEMLETLMKQIQSDSNPDLYKVVKKNEQDFRDLLKEPDKDEAQSEGTSVSSEEVVSKEGKGKPLVIKVTPEERQSIYRLMAMGIPEHRAVQAYFACNKNEEVAAEFLLQQDPLVS